jgi:hypothetical protein
VEVVIGARPTLNLKQKLHRSFLEKNQNIQHDDWFTISQCSSFTSSKTMRLYEFTDEARNQGLLLMV